jgi:thioredoxin-dependent peroxiredoxin
VSPDRVKAHQKFKKAYDLPFTLVSDTDHAIANAYDVWVEKSMFGRRYFGNARTTFIIDEQGRIARIFQNVKSEGHAEEVARALETW